MDQNVKSKKPFQYKRGDRFKYMNRTWMALDFSVTENEKGYKERQWTVEDEQSKEMAYLLLCEESGGQTKEKWVFTRQIPLDEVLSSDELRLFAELVTPSAPPTVLVYQKQSYHFKESYTVKATDDDGRRVPKETWDYFDGSEVKNLAIEIWKEPEGNYPEAYLGIVFDPDMLVYSGSRSVLVSKDFNGMWIVLITGIVLFFFGVPGDWLLAFTLPVVALMWAYILSPSYLPVVIGVALLMLGLLFTVFSTLSGFLCGIAILCLGTLLVRSLALVKKEMSRDIPQVAGLAAFMSTVIYSFFTYFKFAPGPHHAGQLAAVILLPVIIAGATVLVNWGLGILWPNTGLSE